MSREERSIGDLKLPPCPLPRPGDEVIWYTDAVLHRGILEGHAPGGRPCVRSEFGMPNILDSFDLIRLADPSNRRGPAWQYLPEGGRVFAATAQEQSEFGKLLARPIPPRPRYADLIAEVWFRGFEIFVVGGTVRDVLAGKTTHDVDLVTTMPLNLASSLLKAMYRRKPKIAEKHGFVRLGGSPKWGDPFIDLKMFSMTIPGSNSTVFGSDFKRDLGHRDFSCNSVYYDPINATLIDPSGRGITDAADKRLHLVCDPGLRWAKQRAQIVIRYIKFRTRGFTATADTVEIIRNEYLPELAALDGVERLRYMKAQVINKAAPNERELSLDLFKQMMIELGAEPEWLNFFEPLKSELLT